MEALRTIVHSGQLAPFIDLPSGLRNQKVEVIVLPSSEVPQQELPKEKHTNLKSLKGCLKQYANPDLWSLEEDAWGEAVVEKYLEKERERLGHSCGSAVYSAR